MYSCLCITTFTSINLPEISFFCFYFVHALHAAAENVYVFASVVFRDGRILIFSRIPDSDTRHLISGRSRIFDVTTVSLYLQQNT